MIDFTGTYTDQYQLTMSQVYFLRGLQTKKAVFDYFFRALPFQGGYAIFAGLDDLLDILEELRFNKEDLQFLNEQGIHSDFLSYLKNFRFRGTIHSTAEGNIVFPTCPILRVEANLIEAQIVETVLLNVLNFQTLIATKARRMRDVAGKRALIDFGLRRAQGPGGYYASRASMVGGFDATSNVRAGRDFAIPVSGTMAHSFIQSYENELQAFLDYAECWPDHCVLLVDTYNTLKSGVPNAIQVAKLLEKKGHKLKGIRLDSGDLAWLAKRARKMLDEAGLPYVSIIASNQLDEFVIKNLLDQGAPIDVFGVGTNLAIGSPDGALDGVYKLALCDAEPCIKLSDTFAKTTLPGKKQVYRILEKDGLYQGADMISLVTENEFLTMYHPYEDEKSFSIQSFQIEPLLDLVMENGKRLSPRKPLSEISQFSLTCFNKLPAEYKRFINPHLYKVGVSSALKLQRDQLITQYKQ